MTTPLEETALRIAYTELLDITRSDALAFATALRAEWEKELEAQEPVAYRIDAPDGLKTYLESPLSYAKHCTTPLYAKPFPAPVVPEGLLDLLAEIKAADAALSAGDETKALIGIRRIASASSSLTCHVKNRAMLSAPAVPEGYALVPIEPTEEMIEAYLRVGGGFQSAKSDWKAMLAAAPKEPK